MKSLNLPQPQKDYRPEIERVRNRELEEYMRYLNQKIAELEARIAALEP